VADCEREDVGVVAGSSCGTLCPAHATCAKVDAGVGTGCEAGTRCGGGFKRTLFCLLASQVVSFHLLGLVARVLPVAVPLLAAMPSAR
jgi:hypothetical protein